MWSNGETIPGKQHTLTIYPLVSLDHSHFMSPRPSWSLSWWFSLLFCGQDGDRCTLLSAAGHLVGGAWAAAAASLGPKATGVSPTRLSTPPRNSSASPKRPHPEASSCHLACQYHIDHWSHEQGVTRSSFFLSLLSGPVGSRGHLGYT